jgi:group I intron endonuclease
MKEQKIGIIYCATNKINGKMYIGQTTKGLENRINKHCGGGSSNSYFHRAIRKYGKHNFSWKILEDNIPVCKLPNLEMVYIDLFGTFLPYNGYNMTHGGEGSFGRHHSEESKRKMSVSHKRNRPTKKKRQTKYSSKEELKKALKKRFSGKGNPMYGVCGEDSPVYGRTGERHPLFGTHRTECFKDKIARPVLQYGKDGTFIKEWNRVKLAEEGTGANSSSIIRVCQGKQQSSLGFIWRYKNDNFTVEEYKMKVHGKIRPINKLDMNFNFMKKYGSLHDATISVGKKNGSLLVDVCKGKRDSAYGFRWEYADK